MSNLRDFSTAFTESLLARVPTMTQSEATNFLHAIQASRKRQNETLAAICSISSAPTNDDDLAELKVWLNSRARIDNAGPDWFHYIEEAVRARLKELGSELE